MEPFTPRNPDPPKEYTNCAMADEARNIEIPACVAVAGIWFSGVGDGNIIMPYDNASSNVNINPSTTAGNEYTDSLIIFNTEF
jgi:hypothetical protein